jgi:hypothetical protein
MKNYFEAILEINPDSKFSYIDEDIENIKWESPEIPIPTREELDEVLENMAAQKIIESEAKATARASALAKLAALGLSADEIAAL